MSRSRSRSRDRKWDRHRDGGGDRDSHRGRDRDRDRDSHRDRDRGRDRDSHRDRDYGSRNNTRDSYDERDRRGGENRSVYKDRDRDNKVPHNNREYERREDRGQSTPLPVQGKIYPGIIRKVENYGCFVELSGYKQQGLVHISQIAKDKVDDINEVVSINQEVYVKVMKVEYDEMSRRSKLSLSIKYADQYTGADRDPNNIEAELQEKARNYAINSSYANRGPVVLEAVLNTVCTKCGGKGHLATECYNSTGQKYELIEEPEDGNDEDDWTKGIVIKRPPNSVGRGRGATTPAWMKDPSLAGAVTAGNAHRNISKDSSSISGDKHGEKLEKKKQKEEKKMLKKIRKQQRKEMKKADKKSKSKNKKDKKEKHSKSKELEFNGSGDGSGSDESSSSSSSIDDDSI